jgi:putative DNA primase/helicase
MTFTGKQNIGKTTWAARLLPEPMVKRDIRVDPAHVDSVRKAVTALICELGELDAMFRKTDISSLKGFLSQDIDEFRLPYDKVFTRHPRRTAFIATVNEPDFLKDQTGNTRFWVLSVQGLDLDAQKQIDIKQMWAEIVAMYHRGERWHMDTEEMGRIEGNNEAYREVSIEEEMLADMFEWGSDDRDVPMTRTDLMALLEIPGGRRINPAAVTAAARKLTGGSSFQTTISIPGVKLDRNANGETQEVSTVLRKKGRFWFFPEKGA